KVSLALDRAVANNPGGTRGHHIYAFEQRPIPQNAAAGDEFAQATVTEFSELRPDGEDGLSFWRDVEGFIRLVVVESVHAISIVEQHRRFSIPVNQEPMKPSVQARRK